MTDEMLPTNACFIGECPCIYPKYTNMLIGAAYIFHAAAAKQNEAFDRNTTMSTKRLIRKVHSPWGVGN